MKKSDIKINILKEYIFVFLAVLISFALCKATGLKNNDNAIRSFMIIAMTALVGYAFFLQCAGELNSDKKVNIIAAAGIIMGIGYMLYTHIFERGYDQGYVSSNAGGHFGYILNIIEGHLPTSNTEQYYQPPLLHLLAAVFVKIGLLFNGANAEDAVQCVQIVNCAVFCFMILSFRNFIKEIDISAKYQPYVMAVVAFHPNFYYMGGRANNDMLLTFFMLLCIINTYRWYQKRDMKSIICLALSFGLGMMSKISCGIIALLTGPLMIYCAVKSFREKQYKKIILQFAVFAAICLPLALWYPIRNYVLFNQPLNYVQRLSESIPIYIGDTAWYKRFFGFSVKELITMPFFKYPEGCSIPMHLIRTATFGEWSFGDDNPVYQIFIAVNLIMMLVSFAAMIFALIKGKVKNQFRFGLFAVWLILIVSYIQFNISYPFLCTADFRYIAVTALVGAVYMGYAMGFLENKPCGKTLVPAAKGLIIIFSVVSVAAFI